MLFSKEIYMAHVVDINVVDMKVENLLFCMQLTVYLMAHLTKSGREVVNHRFTGKWELSTGEDMHTDSARL